MRSDPELERVISAYFEAAQAGDRSWARRHVRQDDALRVLGTGADEFFAGAEAYEIMTSGDAHLQASVSIRDLEAWSEGSVGWGMARVSLSLPDGQDLPIRWSAVFCRGEDGWEAVQIHTSLPAG